MMGSPPCAIVRALFSYGEIKYEPGVIYRICSLVWIWNVLSHFDIECVLSWCEIKYLAAVSPSVQVCFPCVCACRVYTHTQLSLSLPPFLPLSLSLSLSLSVSCVCVCLFGKPYKNNISPNTSILLWTFSSLECAQMLIIVLQYTWAAHLHKHLCIPIY